MTGSRIRQAEVEDQNQAIRAIGDLLEADAVPTRIPVAGCTAWLNLDADELRRRQTIGMGAVTSTALLSSLWELPSGGSVPSSALEPSIVARLRSAECVVTESTNGFRRNYAPIGTVSAVAFSGRQSLKAFGRAAAFTPIVRRYAVIPARDFTSEIADLGEKWGVGIAIHDGQTPIDARAAEVGIPHVYRWWLAELAFAQIKLREYPATKLTLHLNRPPNPGNPVT
jgi:hypothetical protein